MSSETGEGLSEGTAAGGGENSGSPPIERRTMLGGLSTCVMTGSLVGAYGIFGVYGGRFLYPAKGESKAWLFVARCADVEAGKAVAWETPKGEQVTVTRQGDGNETKDFLALSSTCPHLGCRVFWEPQNDRFFCPCHNGVFAADGSPRSGPPADADQSLLRYPLEVRNGLLFIEVAVTPTPSASHGRA